jgi:hypothetical protein
VEVVEREREEEEKEKERVERVFRFVFFSEREMGSLC